MNISKTIFGKLFADFSQILCKNIFQNHKFSISRPFEQKSKTSFTIRLTKVSKCDNTFRLHFSLNTHQIKPSLNNLIMIIQHLIIMTNKNTLSRFSHTNFYVLILLTNYFVYSLPLFSLKNTCSISNSCHPSVFTVWCFHL